MTISMSGGVTARGACATIRPGRSRRDRGQPPETHPLRSAIKGGREESRDILIWPEIVMRAGMGRARAGDGRASGDY